MIVQLVPTEALALHHASSGIAGKCEGPLERVQVSPTDRWRPEAQCRRRLGKLQEFRRLDARFVCYAPCGRLQHGHLKQ